MNILIKLMSIVSLVIAPTLAKIYSEKIQEDRKEKIEILQKAMSKNEAKLQGITCTKECMEECKEEGMNCEENNFECCK